MRKKHLGNGRNLLLSLFIRRVINWTVLIIIEYYCYQLNTKIYPAFLCLRYIHMSTQLSETISVDFDMTDQLHHTFLICHILYKMKI